MAEISDISTHSVGRAGPPEYTCHALKTLNTFSSPTIYMVGLRDTPTHPVSYAGPFEYTWS